jgi:hypothetical protein
MGSPLAEPVAADEFNRIDFLPVLDASGIEFETDAVGMNTGSHGDDANARGFLNWFVLLPDDFFALRVVAVTLTNDDSRQRASRISLVDANLGDFDNLLEVQPQPFHV